MVDLNIDKSNWQLISFGDVAIQKKGRVDRESTILTRYVKGEHMGSEDIHLREWGELDDEYLGPAFHRRFDEGDILYGSRRTYLKKVCIAPFSGITSNTTFVVEANEEFLDKRLLPFIMLSEGFTKHSIQHSKGSVNPYINWKDLANYEFLLPPKDQQAEIAELLWALDHLIEEQLDLAKSLQTTLDSQTQFRLYGFAFGGMTVSQITDRLNGKGSLSKMPDLGTFLKGKGIPKSQVVSKGLPCIRYGELYTKHHQIVRGINSYISAENVDGAFPLEYGDVLIAGSGEAIEEIGKSAVFLGREQAYCGADILVFRPYVKGGYWGYMLNSRLVREQLNQRGTGAQVAHIYISDLEKIRVPHHNEDKCDTIASTLENTSQAILSTKELIECSRSTLKGLVNDIFSSGHV